MLVLNYCKLHLLGSTNNSRAQVNASYVTVQSGADTLCTTMTHVPSWKWAGHPHVRQKFDAAFGKATFWKGQIPFFLNSL